MATLDSAIVRSLNAKLATGRILTDCKSDFIAAPHYTAVYELLRDELWDDAKVELSSGRYKPRLPITIEVPKRSGLTRPGSILEPLDRFVYQAIVDFIAPPAEAQLDRARVFSNVLLKKDLAHQMFAPNNVSWEHFHEKVREYCEDGRWSFAIRADVANCFERLYQHNLINALHSAGCESKAVTFLEELLSAWTKKDSHGILQGMFPSDFLGNFALCSLDSELIDREIPFARYVDDLYLFFENIDKARVGLVELCKTLRNQGLNLNEGKTKLIETDALLNEETELDRMFAAAKEEAEEEEIDIDSYGFMGIWEEEMTPPEDTKELLALESLYRKVDEVTEHQAENIEKFCLPLLSASASDVAAERSLQGISERPHMSQLYCSYLSKFAGYTPEIVKELGALIIKKERLPYDWQIMWPVALLINVSSAGIQENTAKAVSRILKDHSRSIALRGLCAIFLGKHGNPGQRRNLRDLYSEEIPPYIREAILFSTRYFPTSERKACLRAWKGHSVTNSLIAEAVNKLA